MPITNLTEAILILFAYDFCIGILSSLIMLTPGNKPTGVQYSIEMRLHERPVYESLCESSENESEDITSETIDTVEQEDTFDEIQQYEEETILSDADECEEITENVNEDYLFYEGFDSSFKAYMDYRCITDTASVQYSMQQQAYTDERGFRRIGDDYCVALGTGITGGCGERFMIYLDSGYSFSAVVSDVKSDAHTDETCCYVPRGENSGNVVEFIIDTDYADCDMLSSGNAGYYEDLSGNIISVELIG